MGMACQTLSAGSHASVHSVGLKGPRVPQIPLRSGVKPRRYLGLFLVKRTHVESLIRLPWGYDPRYCCPTALLPSVVGLGVRGLTGWWLPTDLAGGSEQPLGRTSRPPQAGAPGSLETVAPPSALQEAPNIPWTGLPVPPGPVRPVF